LGANSLLLAQFSARLRKHTDLPPVSMRDLYRHTTIRDLAQALGGPVAAAERPVRTGTVVRGNAARHAVFGAAQLVLFLAFLYLSAFVLERGYVWASEGGSAGSVFVRAAGYGAVTFLAACLLPIVAKWLLVGRWKAREIKLWSLGHLRFWAVKTLVRANPLALFKGSPIYTMYLRLLGARIGRDVLVLTEFFPVATDLLTIGAGTVIHKHSSFTGYRAVPGAIQIGPVTIGRDAFVGEKTVLDLGTAIGDGGQLGHTSSLHSGQAIPPGQTWHGVPAEPAQVNYRVARQVRCGRIRRLGYAAWQLLNALVLGPVGFAVLMVALTQIPAVVDVVGEGHQSLTDPAFYLGLAAVSVALFVVGVVGGLAAIIVLPRLLSLFIRPGKDYPLYGLRWIAARTITGLTNSSFYMTLFGDSSAVVGYLRSIGYDLSVVEQTGSNFGTELAQDSPLLTRIGTGTMVSDALSIMNADYSSTSFRMSQVNIGARNFLGNNIAFPANATVGENCLLGTKVMVPVDGPVRENVGLLGSPPFEIPRTVARDTEFDHLKDPGELRRRLSAKNRHNLVSMLAFLGVRWVQVFVATLLFAIAADLYYLSGAAALAVAALLTLVFSFLFTALVERATLGFRRLVPRFVSIYDPYFWRHERLWKLGASPLFSGTPFKPMMWRLLGVTMGRRVFDDGCAIPEKTLVTVGDDAVLNAGSVIQCHSLEDGSFKSDYTVLGAGTVIGVESFVHYGVMMGDGAVLDADAFLMKGEEVAPFARWGGNPATEVRPAVATAAVPQAPAPAAPPPAAPPAPAVRPAPAARSAPVVAPLSAARPVTAAPQTPPPTTSDIPVENAMTVSLPNPTPLP
ncbi:peptide synthetase, partial [Pseudonocardia bannensis]